MSRDLILPTLSSTLRQWVMQLQTHFYWYNLLKAVLESTVSLKSLDQPIMIKQGTKHVLPYNKDCQLSWRCL